MASPTPSPVDGSGESPSRVRYVIVAVATLMSLLLYLDRFSISFALDYIKEDLRLSPGQVDWLQSGFFFSYALAQVPAGWLGDRFGPRRVLVLYILSWSLLTAFTGLAYTFLMFVVFRLAIGAAQAGAYPSCGTLLSRWIPPRSRGNASACVAFGGRAGSAIVHPLTALLILAFVPTSAPVDFVPRDLMNPTGLAKTLVATGKVAEIAKPSPARRVWTLLSDDSRTRMRRLAGKSPESLTDGDRQELLSDLNSLIDRSDLYDASDFASVSLVEEGKWTLRKITEGESIPPAAQRRFNRILLESSFKSDLGKLYNRAWRPVMIVYGLSGVLVAAVFWFYFRDDPSQHPGCNAAERELIAAGRSPDPPSPATHEPFPWEAILTSVSMWGMCVLQFGTNVSWLFLQTYLPTYLNEVHEVPILERGLMTSVPIWVAMAGMLLGGRITDSLTARIGLLWGRRLPMVLTRLLAATGYGLVLVLAKLPADSPFQTPWAYVFAMSLVSLGVDLGVAPVWAFMQDVGGRNVGAILGWGNMWGNLGAFVAPHLYRLALGNTPKLTEWNILFAMLLCASVVSAGGALLVDATRPLSGAKRDPAPPSPNS